MNVLNKEERSLLAIQAIDAFIHSMAGIFLTVFLFVNSDAKTTILFCLISFIGLVFWYGLSGITLKYVSSGSLIRFILFCSALFYLWIFLAKEKAIDYLIPLSVLNGFCMGNYWAAFNLNQYIHTHQARRVKYFGSGLALMNFFQAIGPLIGGGIISLGNLYLPSIDFAGYAILFFIVFVLLFTMSLFIGKLPKHDKISFYYKQIVSHKRKTFWKLVLLQQATLGLYDVTLGTVVAILSFLIIKQEFYLGSTQTLAYTLGVIGGILAIRYLQKNHQFYWIGSLGLFFGILIFAFNQNLLGLIFFITITGFTSPFLNTWISTVYFQALDKHPGEWNEKYFLMIERDVALGIPRVVSYIVLYFFVQLGNQIDLAKKWLFVLPILPIILGFLLKKFDNEVLKNSSTYHRVKA